MDERRPGEVSADIPEEAVAEALAAVERREGEGEERAETAPDPEADPAQASELARLRDELALSQEHGRKGFARLQEEHDRLLRSAADLENYKKRAARERDEAARFGVERLAKELLPVIDNLERALAAAPAGEPLTSGVGMTLRLLEEALGKVGVKGFSAKGERFDPHRHEALMSVATSEHLPGTVVTEHQRGFTLHDRLLRPAAVVVAASPAPQAGPSGEEPAVTASASAEREGER